MDSDQELLLKKNSQSLLLTFQLACMQQDKSQLIFDPHQVFPVPFTLISNVRKSLTSTALKQPFAYEVYCPISCKKIKIGVISNKNQIETMEFNTTSSRWISAYVNGDIKFLINDNNPNKKDRKKAAGDNWSIYLDVHDKGNIAIFNPFYIDSQKPLSLYTFSTIAKAFKPTKNFEFTDRLEQRPNVKRIQLNKKTFYLCEERIGSFISQSGHFEDIFDNFFTIVDPLNDKKTYRDHAKDIKELVNGHLNYWLDQLQQHYILEQTGKSKILEYNIDVIYEKLNYYLNIDQQLRIKLLTNKNKELAKSLYDYHPRVYNALNRLCSFLNYGTTKFDIFKLADLGFFNKTDMLQDLAYIENPQVLIPTAEENVNEKEEELRSRAFPYSRQNRQLPYPNVSLQTCLNSISPQTVSSQEIVMTEVSGPYVIFVDKNKKITAWSGKFTPIKLFEVDLLKQRSSNPVAHKFITQNQSKIQQVLPNSNEPNDLISIGDIFNEQDPKPKPQDKPAPIVPDQEMLQQLLTMGYTVNIAKQALINIKNESIPAAVDEILKLKEAQNKVEKKKPKLKPTMEWPCINCTYINPPTKSVCEMCGTEAQVIDEQEIQQIIKQEEEQRKKQEQVKLELERKKSEEQRKKIQEEEKKNQQLLSKKQTEEFLRNSQITYAKLFRSKTSSVNPFILAILLVDRHSNKSVLKVIRIGQNRLLLTQFYRYENNSFVSNFNRNIYQEKQRSIEPLDKIISESWDQVEVLNRLINPFRSEEYFVLDEKDITFEMIVQGVKCDGENILVSLNDDKSKKYRVVCSDDLDKSNFQVVEDQSAQVLPQSDSQKIVQSYDFATKSSKKIIKPQGQNTITLTTSNSTTTAFVEIVEHIPAGHFKPLLKHNHILPTDAKNQTQIVMSEFLPLMIENYEGSIFSSKYHVTSLFERGNLYISNYPEANFTFKSITGKSILAETVTVISQNKRLQKIYPIETGLVFTANQLSWFDIAKTMFSNFKRKEYNEWLNSKKDRNGHREFWEPVAFFELESQTQVEIDYKRSAKYIFFLPTSVRTHSEKADVAALKVDFFGVKGRIEEVEQKQHSINNFKDDCLSETTLSIEGQNDSLQNMIVRKRTGVNTMNFIPKSYEGFEHVQLSISTVYELKFKTLAEQTIKFSSPYLQYGTVQMESHSEQPLPLNQLDISSYKNLLDNYNDLTEEQVLNAVQKLEMKDLIILILSNTKSFRVFEKILKIIYETESLKNRLFEAMQSLLPKLCDDQYEVNEYGLKTFLRIFEKIAQMQDYSTFKNLTYCWSNITEYVKKIRNKNYTVLRNSYGIEELVLQPQLFSRDYYRLIYPNYIEEEPVSTIVQQPKTELNNTSFIEKQNHWYYRTLIDLKEIRNVQKLELYFPKILQSANRFKLGIRLFEINDQEQRLVYYRTFNEQLLYQFATVAFKEKEIYSEHRINYFTIDANVKTRFLRLEYNYLLLTTLNSLRYKEPTQNLMLYPVVKSTKAENNEEKPFALILKQIESTYPKQTKHSSIVENIPPVKYATDRSFSLYEIYEFPVINHESVSKQFTSLIDKITTNIMDKTIIDQCMKNMKISQYQFNQKGLDFGYTFLINVLKLFKKMPADVKVDPELLHEMFDVFVVYEIGPIMKKVMAFIAEVYKRFEIEEKKLFVSRIITKYLAHFSQYKELKETQKYSLTKVIQKLEELELPVGLLMQQLSTAYTSNNRFLVSMLLKLIRPNIQKFGLLEQNLKQVEGSSSTQSVVTLKQMINTTFKFNLWVLNNVESVKVELLSQGLDLLLTFMDGKHEYIQKNKSDSIKEFINSIEEQEIWKLVFLTLKIKNEHLNKKLHDSFQIFMQNTTQKFKKSINTMVLEIIKKQPDSTYSRINGSVNDDLWMNHLQTILEYIDIDSKVNEPQIAQNGDQKEKKKQFSLDIDTAIELLNLPLTPVLWSHALLIIPKEDKVLNAIIKNFKQQYYSTLGKEITKFCQPLAGIRSLESIHINWLDLVRKIRLQNRSIFSLFAEQLRKSSFGGKEGVAMASQEEVKQLQITSEFLKLVLEKSLPVNEFNEEIVSQIFVWYFLNNTDAKGESPASEYLKIISQNVLKIIKKMSQIPELIPICIKCILQIKKDSEKMEGMFQENRIATHSALILSKRFCKCFEDLMMIFVSNDKMSHYFAFDINGLEYLMEKLNLMKTTNTQSPSKNIVSSEQYLPEEEFLLNEKILSKKVEASNPQSESKFVEDLIGEQFCTNVKLVASMNQTASTTSTDWTVYKKGNKTKIIFLPMNDPATYYEYPLYIQLARTAEVRSIKIGFPCASFEFTDKTVVSPSAVVIEGSADMKSFEPLGEMTYIDDDGYLCNGVKVFALNLQKVKSSTKIDEAIKGIQVHRIKYLKIVVKRPLVTFIEGQYSQMNGRTFTNVGVSISFLSVLGDDTAKIPNQLVDSCKEMSKKTALNILASLMTQSNLETMKKISNEEKFSSKVKENFHQLKQLMYKYKQTVPQIIYTLGSNNTQLGDWLIEHFIKSAKEQSQAKIINQIIVSTPSKIYQRINYFQRELFKQFAIIRSQSEAQASLLYSKYVPFMESFCKTLEECYEIDFKNNSQTELVLDCDQVRIDYLIDIYDKKHSSPDIKSLLKLLIAFIWIRKPLKLSQEVIFNTLDLIWKNCSESKPYFYKIMSALLVSKISMTWISKNDHEKVKSLINEIQDSITKENYKALKSQMFLLSILSYHEADYLRYIEYHMKIYNSLKGKLFEDGEIYEYLMKILQNVVLGSPQEEEKLATVLIQDVSLLVKRKDPILQKLFVGLLGVEQEVMIHLRGLSLLSIQSKNKKVEGVPSKILTRQQQKSLSQKLNNQFKYHLAFQAQNQITLPDMTTIIQALYTGNTLIIIKVKKDAKIYHIGAYCPVKPVKHQDDEYYWQEQVTADKNCFLFTFCEKDHTYLSCDEGTKMLSVHCISEEEDIYITLYQNARQVLKLHQDSNTLMMSADLLMTKDKNLTTVDILGIEIFECKAQAASSSSDSKLSQLLSKSNQAKTPFTWYRHNQIYIFPSEITISKLQKLLSAKISIENISEINPNMKLKEIQNQDYIIDVTIENPDDYSGQQDFGYIPKMNIFNSFSKLNGIKEVLRLGSQSINDWKNATRKKNFEHYMDQLKSFIHLPNFFSLFIKNHTYVTFLFEVAAGMPDDTFSTRNWEEEEVNSSRFIYKILSEIFKFDKSKELRDMEKYKEFCDIILQKLSEISKEAPRVFKEEQAKKEEEQELQVAETLEKKKTEEQKRKKKKGTGYGADNQNSSKWSSAEWLENKKMMSQQTLRVVSIFVSFLDCEVPIQDQRLNKVIKSSCLLPLIESALRSSSLLEIAKEIDLFKCYLSIIKNLAKNPSTIGCLLEIEKNYKPQQTESIHSLLGKLNNISDIFLECLKSGKETSNTENQNTESLATEIQKTYHFIDKAVKSLSKGKNIMTIKQINELPIQNAYRILLEKLRFGYIDMKKGAAYEHCLHSSISTSSPSTQKILRLSQELADLSSSLPCEHTNSIFVRCDKSRIDLIKILIMGSKDTPYSNGAFMFDLYCDDSYPNNPPKMVIATTGQGKIRFNPNLYSCGKVCLSLLGTWRGSASENWDPKLSTLLQLFISTQGITMSDDVYFNEPGFDGQQGTQEGQKKNQAYSNIVRLGNVKYAMIEQIRNPPKGFEDVIQRHFYVKKNQILEECDKWLQWAEKRQASYAGLVSDHNSSWCTELKVSKTKYKELLEKEINTLRQVLEKIPQPDLKEKNEEEATFSKVEKKKRKAKQAELQIDVAYDKENKGELKIEEGVMQDRWSRYIGAMGLEAVKKQSSSNVLLVGLRSLGLQIAKNLILSGLQKLTIVQDSVLESGTQQHFYMSDLKGKKIQDCIFKLKELNPYMIVDHVVKLPESFKDYNLVVSTLSVDSSIEISQKCRTQNVKFVYSETCGVAGSYFADFGENFTINDTNGEESFEGLIQKITCEKQAVVKLLDGVKHPYEDGDYVVISKVEGMQLINQSMEEISQAQAFYNKMISTETSHKLNNINGHVFQIKVINWNSFSIGDTTNFKPYVRNGIVKNIKVPKSVKFESFENCLKDFDKFVDPNMGIYDFEKMGDNFSLFASFVALSRFELKSKTRPQNWNELHCKEFVEIVKQVCEEYKKSQQETKSITEFATKFSLISEAELPTIGAYLGGIVSQQIIKGLTNKYTPIKQFFVFHLNELIQMIPSQQAKWTELSVKKEEPFRNIKIVIGQENMNKIESMNLFIVGAGAIGCELLKNFAMVNMGSKGKITVTDPDHIETSNLTRQFLFRQKHVKKPKSATASAVLIQMNPNLKNHISARLDKVCQESEDIYSDEFFKQQTVIANALDNVRARQYMDKRCVINKVPLFESGTLGPKGHVQVIVPYKTENYGSQADPQEETQIPHCTLKMFPEDITHCIEWSRDIFGKIFTLNPKALKKVIQSKDTNSIQGKQKSTVLKMVKHKPNTFEDCINEAVRIFFKYFRNDIRQLLYTYPLEMKTKQGKLFWTLPKRPPVEVNKLDSSDESHQTFIASYAVLFAKIFSIDYPKDFRKPEGKANIMEQAINVKLEDFVPSAQKSKQLQELNEKQEKNKQKITEAIEKPEVQSPSPNVEEEIKLTPEVLQLSIKPEQFEKDEDSNGHIDLIYSMSNLRAKNYDIAECKWIEAKLKAGRIMAALSTTTSVVAAIQTLQIIKLVSGSQVWRNAFVNLAVPLVQISEPGPAVKQKIGNTQFSVWQDWQFKATSLKDLLTQIRQKYEIEGFNISTSQGTPIFWQAMYKDKQQAQQSLLNKKLSQLIGKDKSTLNIVFRDIKGETIYQKVPKIIVQATE